MPKYRLIYSKNRGKAEVSRMLFSQAGVEFEDKRIQYRGPESQEWTELKPSMLIFSDILPSLNHFLFFQWVNKNTPSLESTFDISTGIV